MDNFDLNKFQTLKDLFDEETMVGENEETCDLLNYGPPGMRFSIRKWCDNLDNIIESE
jgi:hypothetical protein